MSSVHEVFHKFSCPCILIESKKKFIVHVFALAFKLGEGNVLLIVSVENLKAIKLR